MKPSLPATPISRARILPAVGIAFVLLVLTACGGRYSSVAPIGGEPFERENLRSASSVLVVSSGAEATAYGSAVRKLYGSVDSLPGVLARALADSLNGGTPAVPVRLAGLPAVPDSMDLNAYPGFDSLALETGARYILRLRRVGVSNALRQLPTVTVPSGYNDTYSPSGGGTSESCVVTFEVEIWETEGAFSRRHVFVVTGRSDLFLWAYKSAVRETVRRAVATAAQHLRGD
jgi:hypothetical protein